ncbi:unnamed protein product, partial [marine sediment metagenome]
TYYQVGGTPISHLVLSSTGTNTHAEIDTLLSSLDSSTDTLRTDVTNLETSTSTLEGDLISEISS